jgi:hypothetical protein
LGGTLAEEPQTSFMHAKKNQCEWWK